MQYEILSNPATVDLLVSITYAAAAENVLDEPLPIGLGLRVPVPDVQVPPNTQGQSPAWLYLGGVPMPLAGPTATFQAGYGHPPVMDKTTNKIQVGTDGLCDFDDLSISEVCITTIDLLSYQVSL
jgi:ubiquitin-conjugating enzyme E2 Q